MAVLPSFANGFWAVNLGDVFPEVVVQATGVDLLHGVMGLGLVNRHIKDAEVELSKVEEGVVDVAGGNDAVDKLVGHLLCGLLVSIRAGLFPGAGVFGEVGTSAWRGT